MRDDTHGGNRAQQQPGATGMPMTYDSGSALRRLARAIRHHPRLKMLDPLWRALRKPYLSALKVLAGKRGIEVHIAGNPMWLDPLFATQNWEEVEAESYSAYVQDLAEGMVVFDIGAHIGTYAILALKRLGPRGKVIAYEPHPLTRKYLLQHLDMNPGGAGVVVRDLCCGSSPGTASFYFLPDRTEGTSGLVPVNGFQQREVKVTTVDAEVSELGLHPDILKIDVEGAELEVLKGAEATLTEDKPVIFLSIHPQALAKVGRSEADVVEWLSGRGYECTVLVRDHEVHVRAASVLRH